MFRRLRCRLLRNGLRTAWQQNRTRLVTITFTSLLTVLFTFAVSYFLFHQLRVNNIPLKGAIVEALFDLLFFILGFMLLISTGLILFGSLFNSTETRFLLTTPATADRIFATQYVSAIMFSSWGFVVLGIPIFVAYGWVAHLSWDFYLIVPLFLCGYVLVPSSLAAAACLAVVRYLPGNRRAWLWVVAVLLAAAGLYWLYRVGMGVRQTMLSSGRELQDLLEQFAWVRSGLTPSRWMTRGVMAAVRGDYAHALLRLAQVWSNGLMLYVAAAWLAGRLYRSAYDRYASSGHRRQRHRRSILDWLMERAVWYLSPPLRAVVVKDFRTFRRDPSQWGVLLIFTVLMMIGAGNFRTSQFSELGRLDKYLISFMNFFGTAMLLCAILSRFVFPLISLEGKKFWVLGLAPLPRASLLWSKLAFAFTGGGLFAVGLIVLSDLLIGLPPALIAMHIVAMLLIAAGLSALNVGLGAVLANFRESNPAKIVTGFGGTVNMVLGLGYLVVMIACTIAPIHVSYFLRSEPERTLQLWHYAGFVPAAAMCAGTIGYVMRRGIRALQTAEM